MASVASKSLASARSAFGHRGRVAVGPQRDERRDRWILEVVHVHLRTGRRFEAGVPDVADDADHRAPRARRIGTGANVLADWIVAAEHATRHRLVDDDRGRAVRAVLGSEAAAPADGNAHGREVVVHGAPELHFGQVRDRHVLPLDLYAGGDAGAAERDARGAADGRHAGNPLQPFEPLGVVGAPGVRRREPVRDAHLQREQVIGTESRVEGHHRREAAQQQAGTHAQDHGERQLGDDQRGAHPVPRAGTDRTATGFLQRGPQIGARGEQRGHDTDQGAGDERHPEGHEQHGRVWRHFLHARQVRRRQRDQRLHAPAHHDQPQQASGQCQQQTLRQRLLHQARPSGAERRPHRQFLLPAHAARQDEVGDVDASHQQDHRDTAGQDQQRRADVTHHLFVQRVDRGRPPLVGVGIRLFQARCGRGQSRARLLDADARLQPADRAEIVHVADEAARLIDHPRPRHHHRRPRVHVHRAGEAGGPDHALVREHELGWHDADDRRGLAVHGHLTADDGRVAAKAPLPVAVTDHRDARAIAWLNGPAEHRRSPEQLEQPRADERRHRDLWRAVEHDLGVGDEREVAFECRERSRLHRAGPRSWPERSGSPACSPRCCGSRR